MCAETGARAPVLLERRDYRIGFSGSPRSPEDAGDDDIMLLRTSKLKVMSVA